MRIFQSYLAPAVVREVVRHPDLLRLGGERRELTVLFSDIAGFSRYAENLPPEEVAHFLNTYLGTMSKIVTEHAGTLDKYVGDAVMAFWGAPLPQPNHALLACRAALEARDRARSTTENGGRAAALHTRFGINTGVMVVGNLGSEQRFDYTVIGDSVNLASRLEGTNKVFGTDIIVGARTREEVREILVLRELDRLRVQGRRQPEIVYEVIGELGSITPQVEDLLGGFAEGLAAYRGRDFESARRFFAAALAAVPADGPAQVYARRCGEFLDAPPPRTTGTASTPSPENNLPHLNLGIILLRR